MGQVFFVDELAKFVDSRDRFSLLMMIEDGRFLQNIHEYISICPKDASIAILVACPYLTLIEHGPMRNALVHYDFRQFPESKVSGNEHADYDFINVLKRLTGMTLNEFDEFLSESTAHACSLLSSLLGIGFG